VVTDWSVVHDGGVALDAVLGRGFDPSATAVVEGNPLMEPIPGTAPGSAAYREPRPEDVRIDADANGPSLVVVRNTWERGWSATVDGRPAPLVRADLFLQAVPVPAGSHVVRLVYRDPAIAQGLVGSAAVWIAFALTLAGVVAAATRRTSTSPAPPPGA
jgi:hypothetical protein